MMIQMFFVVYLNRQLYGDIQDVLVPQMYVEQTTRKVLLMEWIEVFLFHALFLFLFFSMCFN